MKANRKEKNFPLNSFVCVNYDKTGVFFRGKIISLNNNDQVTIFDVDTGANLIIDKTKIHKLLPYFTYLPALAIHMSLSDVEPIDNKWSNNSM